MKIRSFVIISTMTFIRQSDVLACGLYGIKPVRIVNVTDASAQAATEIIVFSRMVNSQ